MGSAQKNLSARIERHARQHKPLRWHMDYLSAHASILGAILIPGGKDKECGIAQQLSEIYDLAIPRFGASDCRCPGHLFYAEIL